MPHSGRRTVDRHARTVIGRTSHGQAGLGPPTDPLYGSLIDYEMIGQNDIGPDSIPPGAIPPGSIPPDALDPTAPDVPTGIVPSSGERINADGSRVTFLRLRWVDPADTDLHGVFIEITSEETIDGGLPDWSASSSYFVGAGVQTLDILGVVSRTKYYFRLRSVDGTGNKSASTVVQSYETTRDTVPPPVPGNPSAVGGFRGAIFRFDPVPVNDIDVYEIRYTTGTSSVPGTSWATIRARTTNMWVSGLTPKLYYWFQVQAIDQSGNVSGFSGDQIGSPTVAATWALISEVGAADIAANSISSVKIATEGLDAGVIKTGLLQVNTTDADKIDGIVVTKAAVANPNIGRWDENGLKISSPTESKDFVLLDSAELSVWKNASKVTAMNVDGINASAVKFGNLDGGHNLVLNSSFEFGPFSSETVVLGTTFTTDDQLRTTKAAGVVGIDGAAW